MKNVITHRKFVPIWIIMGALTLTISGCSKEDNPLPDDPFIAPTAMEFSQLRESAMARHTEKVLFNAEDGISFTSNDGAELYITPGCLMQNGVPATGEVELTFIDIYHRADMAPTNKPTMGLKPNGDKAMLITGGELFVEVRKNGQLLEPGCSFAIKVPGENTGEADPEMILWNGIIDENGDLTWDPIEPGGHNRLFVEQDMYHVNIENFGWTNIDKFYSDPREKTTLMAKAPEGFNYENSAIYLTYDGEGHALAQLDTFDEESGIFSEHYGQIPIGLEVHLIFVSAEGDQYRFATKGITIAEGQLHQFLLEETSIGTYGDFESAINNLP